MSDASDDTQDKAAPETTEDLKQFLNNPEDELPDAQVDEVDRAPGGVDADPNESDVGHGESDDNLVAEQPLSAQTDESDVPDEVQEPDGTKDESEDHTDSDPEDKSEEPD